MLLERRAQSQGFRLARRASTSLAAGGIPPCVVGIVRRARFWRLIQE